MLDNKVDFFGWRILNCFSALSPSLSKAERRKTLRSSRSTRVTVSGRCSCSIQNGSPSAIHGALANVIATTPLPRCVQPSDPIVEATVESQSKIPTRGGSSGCLWMPEANSRACYRLSADRDSARRGEARRNLVEGRGAQRKDGARRSVLRRQRLPAPTVERSEESG